MTKKISLEEARKLATPGKLRFEPGLVPYTHVNLISDEGEIASVWGVGAHLPPDGKEEANAVLLAHRWNTHDELVEALEKLRAEVYGPDCVASVETCALVDTALERAQTVELP